MFNNSSVEKEEEEKKAMTLIGSTAKYRGVNTSTLASTLADFQPPMGYQWMQNWE